MHGTHAPFFELEKMFRSFFADIRTCLQLSRKRETSPTSNRKLSPVFHT
jgi:hypothetical protein